MAQTPTKMHITRLKVVNWRNFREAEVYLAPRAFFVGPNAAGKSNLLDAVRFLRDIVKPIGGGLATAIADRRGFGKIRTLHQKGRQSDVGIEIGVGTSEDPNLWSYSLYFNKISKSKTNKELVVVKKESILHRGHPVLDDFRFDENEQNLDLFTQSKIQQVSDREKFSDLVYFLQQIQYLHIVPQIVRDARRQADGDDPFGGDLLRRIQETTPRTRDARLKRLSQALAIAVPQFGSLVFETDEMGRPHLAAAFRHWRNRPSPQREDQFSDGTLRLIGFLWAISEPGGPLLLEEPELSLNDEIVSQLPRMVARMQRRSSRQVLVTTHSRALLSDEGIGLDEVHQLVPTDDGTKIVTTKDDSAIRSEVDAGFSVGDSVLPRTNQKDLFQLSSFDAS